MTDRQARQKDAALHQALWALSAAFAFCEIISRKKCRCGVPPNTDGVHCDACCAIILRNSLMDAVKNAERAHDCDKQRRRKKPVARKAS